KEKTVRTKDKKKSKNKESYIPQDQEKLERTTQKNEKKILQMTEREDS
ncbi:30155_t:CDS:1, partial [Racocetra persica]